MLLAHPVDGGPEAGRGRRHAGEAGPQPFQQHFVYSAERAGGKLEGIQNGGGSALVRVRGCNLLGRFPERLEPIAVGCPSDRVEDAVEDAFGAFGVPGSARLHERGGGLPERLECSAIGRLSDGIEDAIEEASGA